MYPRKNAVFISGKTTKYCFLNMKSEIENAKLKNQKLHIFKIPR